jgi:hypothetical protein
LKKFLFATRQHVLIIFYIASQVGQKNYSWGYLL